jgi:hypothetical protein
MNSLRAGFSMSNKIINIFAIIITLFLNILFAQSGNILEIPSIEKGEIRYKGFKIETGKAIRIRAVGAGADRVPRRLKNYQNDPSGMFVYGWIIDAQTRKSVWQMTADNTSKVSRTRFNREFEGKVDLPAGEYEIYFTAQSAYNINSEDGFFSLGKLLDRWLRGDEERYEHYRQQWNITIQNIDEVSDESIIDKFHKKKKEQAIIAMTDILDSDFLQQGFTLTESGEFEIYAIGEAFDGEEFDYGWISSANSGKKIWEMTDGMSEHAGGAIKNRIWRNKIRLEPGEYWVYYSTDDSHSPQGWNANPPYDPIFYGINITGIPGKFNPESVKEVIKLKVKPIIDIRRVGNDEYIEEAFEIDEQMKIRIHALGEGRHGEMFDYAWITNIENGEKVWTMNFNETRHGGGASKNRMIDIIITLPTGKYKVSYLSDGSHSYEHFNSQKPYEPANWGIAVYPADVKYSEKHIRKLAENTESPYLITQLIKVRDDQHLRKGFSLDKETEIRVYAIGEGSWDEMYDYGWIEDGDEDIVWEMTYENTRWAGGAKKNRKVEAIITLKPGDYVLNYTTDDSHSFNDFNDDPPDDPINYGISLYRVTDRLGGKN